MEHLEEANIWLECLDYKCLQFLYNAPELFALRPETANKVVFNLKESAYYPLEPLEQAGIQIRRRLEPEFYGDVYGSTEVVRGLPVSIYGPCFRGRGAPQPRRRPPWAILPSRLIAVVKLIAQRLS
jgi:hypothetical protein